MNRIDFPKPLTALIRQLKRLPGIGPRGAERIALWLIQSRDARPRDIIEALAAADAGVSLCPHCGFFLAEDDCAVCGSLARDTTLLCVVEQPTDVIPIERSGAYDGSYHVLGGRLAPLDGVGPEDLRIPSLLTRLDQGSCSEVILALGGDVEGEATANFLADLLAGRAIRVTRLAQGLPVGGGLDQADMLTVSRAIQHRR